MQIVDCRFQIVGLTWWNYKRFAYRARRRVESALSFNWEIVEGVGVLDRAHDQAVSFLAPDEPGLVRISVTVSQGDIERTAEALITVTHELLPQVGTANIDSHGLPGYTFERAR